MKVDCSDLKAFSLWFLAERTFWQVVMLNLLMSQVAVSHPYFDESQVPKDIVGFTEQMMPMHQVDRSDLISADSKVLRVDVQWIKKTDTYTLQSLQIEASGTELLRTKSKVKRSYGSYKGILIDEAGNESYYSIGMGRHFRRLMGGLSFRFPYVSGKLTFKMLAEHPLTGAETIVIDTKIEVSTATETPILNPVDIKLVKEATASPKIQVAVFSEGYTPERGRSNGGESRTSADQFWKDVAKTVVALANSNLPTYANFEIIGVYAPSKVALGEAQDYGSVALQRNSALGLFYPYWFKFGRWYHVVYPTENQKYHNALATVPYDYPIALIDSDRYFGVGNYNEITAVPAHHPSFTYLLIHEFGHFLGLNEEYEGGGPTELEFAPGVFEPWSPNITFHPKSGELKWQSLVSPEVALPTPQSSWNIAVQGPIGAYKGGYADSDPKRSYKPGFACVMQSGTHFCPVCQKAILDEFKSIKGSR